MHKTTLLIPIHSLEENILPYFDKCVESVLNQRDKKFNLAIIVSENVDKELLTEKTKSLLDLNLKVYINTSGKTSYQAQLNFFVDNFLETEYVSILQYDDILLDNYIYNVNKYVNSRPDVDMFLPLIIEVNKYNVFNGLTNEAVWAYGNMDEMGELDLDNLLKKNGFRYSLCGCTIKKDSYISIGKMKESMAMFLDYEFMFRLTDMGYSTYVIPKMMYRHFNGIKNSILDKIQSTSEDEKHFWRNHVYSEYKFENDRNITYKPVNS